MSEPKFPLLILMQQNDGKLLLCTVSSVDQIPQGKPFHVIATGWALTKDYVVMDTLRRMVTIFNKL